MSLLVSDYLRTFMLGRIRFKPWREKDVPPEACIPSQQNASAASAFNGPV